MKIYGNNAFSAEAKMFKTLNETEHLAAELIILLNYEFETLENMAKFVEKFFSRIAY